MSYVLCKVSYVLCLMSYVMSYGCLGVAASTSNETLARRLTRDANITSTVGLAISSIVFVVWLVIFLYDLNFWIFG